MNFYDKAPGLKEENRHTLDDGYITIILGDGSTDNKLELTWSKSQKKLYDLDDNEFHIDFKKPDFDGVYTLHKMMGCICYENKEMGIYFINDPGG